MSSTILVACILLAAPAAQASDDAPITAPRRPFWATGPAGAAFGLFIDSGLTAGQFGFDAFAAGSLEVGVSLRWFEASVIGYGGSSLDGAFSGGAFLTRVALRVPVKYVAFTLGPSLGYVEVPGHLVSGVAFEPLSVGLEIDPVCHLRIGLLGAWAEVFGDAPEGAVRGALTVGYVMGRCQ